MFNKVARFIIRPTEDNKADIILGVMYNSDAAQNQLKPNVIYEIQDIMGELVVVEVGDSELKLEVNRTGVTWNHAVGDIIDVAGKYIFLTGREFDGINKLL